MNATTAPRAASAGYSVAKSHGICHGCQQTIAVGDKFTTALKDSPAALERLDYCPACWEKADHTDLLGYWQTMMPLSTAKKPLFVNDDVLCELFERLSDVSEPAKLNFRFVLGLILMRKRRLVYESTRLDETREIWIMRFRGKEEKLELLNPKLSEEQVGEVSGQLGEILNADL
jgi:hypothetical protein